MTREERELALYCLKASSDYHSEVCENCINYPNCDHTIQDDVTETIIEALEQEPKTIQEIQAESEKYQKAFEDGYEQGYAQARFDYEQEPILDKIEPKCDRINSLASVLPYTAHREIQELLCEIMDLCKESEE